ncbi:MAG: hypothetical protein HKN04_08745 [Rhodothermaceae bacterium]|nr:hypothetical protein [Rhodothermaceae bacterium]
MRSLFLLSLSLLIAGCAGGPPGDDSPLQVTATNGTAETTPLFSWSPVAATSLWVTDADGRTVWGIEPGGRSLPENRYEHVLIASPVPYGAYANPTSTSEETPRTTTPPGPLLPGETYTVNVTHLGGGSGGFTGRRPIVRRGSATFSVAVRIDP